MKLDINKIVDTLRDLNATDENSAVPYFDIARVLGVNPHDSSAIFKMKEQCKLAKEAKLVVLFVAKPPNQPIAMLYVKGK